MPCTHPMHDTDCPFDCVNPDPRCEYCAAPASDERTDRGRVMLVCDQCADSHDMAARMDRDERLREQAVDAALQRWKDER